MTWIFSGHFEEKYQLECLECSAKSPRGDTHNTVIAKFKPQLIEAGRDLYCVLCQCTHVLGDVTRSTPIKIETAQDLLNKAGEAILKARGEV